MQTFIATETSCIFYKHAFKGLLASYPILRTLLTSHYECQVIELPCIIEIAKSQINQATYKLQAPTLHAPKIVDCSSFIQWLFVHWGIRLPRISLQQRNYLSIDIEQKNLQYGDLIFTTGYYKDYFYTINPNDAVGHVGLFVGKNCIIHADQKQGTVVETHWIDFFENREWRGARRVLSNREDYVCVTYPKELGFVTNQDLYYYLLPAILHAKETTLLPTK